MLGPAPITDLTIYDYGLSSAQTDKLVCSKIFYSIVLILNIVILSFESISVLFYINIPSIIYCGLNTLIIVFNFNSAIVYCRSCILNSLCILSSIKHGQR